MELSSNFRLLMVGVKCLILQSERQKEREQRKKEKRPLLRAQEGCERTPLKEQTKIHRLCVELTGAELGGQNDRSDS